MQLKSYETPICNVHIGYDTDSNERPTNEQWAVAAAMFSRSTDGIQEILKKITADKSSKFLDQFYIGYGHGSIGDLVNVQLFVEKIPLYVACMLEHHSRFSGQESSTRYLDFSKQRPAYDADQDIYKKQIDTYLAAVEKVTSNLTKYGSTPDADSGVVARAIKARAFDICRSLLPWGATTNVAWYGNIRSITQHLAWLISDLNPNRDYTNIKPYVETIYNALQDFLPSSVTRVLADTRPGDPWPYPNIDKDSWTMEDDVIFTMESKDNDSAYPLDFGSWRDLNRHRIGKHTIDFKERFGAELHVWYEHMLRKHDVQYHVPETVKSINERLVGEEVKYSYTCHPKQLDYLVFRRGQDDVHPTLRNNVLEIARDTDREAPKGEHDPGAFGFFLRRGTQTISVRGK